MNKLVFDKWIIGTKEQDAAMYQKLVTIPKEELITCFAGELSFGTGGMRGVLGVGPNRMNRFTVRQAIYGFARTLPKKAKVIIGYDTRNMSKEFAQEACGVLLANGQKVYLFDDYAPTPEIVYAVKTYVQADFGIVITASHNPKEYNGIKIYNNQGSQLVPEEIAPIIEQVNLVEDVFSIPVKKFDQKEASLVMLGTEVDQAYIAALQSICCQADQLQQNESVPFIYTPLHGTGQRIFGKLMQYIEQNNFLVCQKQTTTDGSFFHAPAPNPEDSTVFQLSIELAKKHEAALIFATDPDADRLGVMVKVDNRYQQLTGNQVGMLLLDYLIQQATPAELTNKVVLSTIVSTGMVHTLSQMHGFHVQQFLTGFKYIGHCIGNELAVEDFLFGFEESCGYLIQPIVQDKDAFQAMVLLLEMVYYYRNKGQTLWTRLTSLYQQYGYYLNELETIELSGQPDLTALTKQLSKKGILEKLGFKAFEDYRRNVQLGESTFFKTGVETDEEFLRLSCDADSWICIRSSGTEPKLKIYYEMVAKTQKHAAEKLAEYQEKIQQLLKSKLDLEND